MAVGSLSNTPPSRVMALNFFKSDIPMNVRLPNLNLRTGRLPSDGRDKAFWRTFRVNTTRAWGTTTTTRVLPSASEATSDGVNTVVLPLPMIICLNEDFFAEASSHSVRAVCTWASRKMMSQALSMRNRRASYTYEEFRCEGCALC